jgi:hypothetical protein
VAWRRPDRRQWIGIEDLNVRGMVRNRHLSRSVIEGAFFEFRRQLDYKSRLYGSTWSLTAGFLQARFALAAA